MYCRKCGAQNEDNAYKCTQCGEVLQQANGPTAPPQKVPNYLAQSILVTILCCVPLGIPAIVYSAQVNGKLASGDLQGALAASKNAKMWGWIAFGAGLFVGVFYIILMLIGAVAGKR